MNELTADLLYHIEAELGEGALWDDRSSKLLWVDILAGYVHRFNPITKVNETFEIGQPVGTVALDEDGDLVLAVKNGFARYNTTSQEFSMLKIVEHENSSIRFNDGKCDPSGRFWAGTMSQDGTPAAGNLYCLEDLSLTQKISKVGISNGLGWSPGSDTMYYIDSASQKVLAFGYDVRTGSITSPRTVFEIEATEGTPDGMCVDADGKLWVALWGGGKVMRIDPENGERLCEVRVPNVSKVTSCALGGEDMSTLYITTARQGFTEEDIKNEPNAGSLFCADVGVRGLLTSRFTETLRSKLTITK